MMGSIKYAQNVEKEQEKEKRDKLLNEKRANFILNGKRVVCHKIWKRKRATFILKGKRVVCQKIWKKKEVSSIYQMKRLIYPW